MSSPLHRFGFEGRIVDEDWSHYDYEHVVFRPARLSVEQLQEGIQWIWRETYRMQAIARRMLHTPLSRLENLIYNIGFRHHALAVGKKHNHKEKKSWTGKIK